MRVHLRGSSTTSDLHACTVESSRRSSNYRDFQIGGQSNRSDEVICRFHIQALRRESSMPCFCLFIPFCFTSSSTLAPQTSVGFGLLKKFSPFFSILRSGSSAFNSQPHPSGLPPPGPYFRAGPSSRTPSGFLNSRSNGFFT